MSVSTFTREVHVTTTRNEARRLYCCDGPGCDKTVEQPAPAGPMLEDPMLNVPPGWIFLDTSDRKTSQHYCSRDCLADAVVP